MEFFELGVVPRAVVPSILPGTPSPEPGLFAELRRRNVFRVAAMYAVVEWLLIQIGEATFDALRLPGVRSGS